MANNNGLKQIKVSLERIVYQDEENGFTVARAAPENMIEDEITVVGNLPAVFPGQKLNLKGFWDHHSEYGRQFQVKNCRIDLPATEAGIQQYLASDFIDGVGPVIAERITDKFGEDSLNVIDQNPDKLTEVEGIGTHRLERIKEGWKEGKEIRNIMIFLKEHGVSTAYSVKIYKEYGEDTVEILEDDPYQLARDVFGIGFRTADRIARKLGLGEAELPRLKAGVEYALQEATNDGHLYLPRRELVENAAELLDAQKEQIQPAVDELIREERIIEESDLGEGTPQYLAPFYYGEVGVVNRIEELMKRSPRVNEGTVADMVEKFTETREIDYNKDQISAIKKSVTDKVLLITGGPGTGKTTVLQGIIELMEKLDKEVGLAAPTGRAAKRLEEATGREAETIHRLLGFRPPNRFEHDENNKLDADAVIVDEVSMVDMLLANNLLKAVPDRARLILVGDKDQLPSVGAGNVLHELLNSEAVARVELTEIFRQARESRIVTNAHRINQGDFPNLKNSPDGDFFFIEESESEEVAKKVVNLVDYRLPKKYNLNPKSDIQVLAPMHRGEAGVDSLNKLLQDRLNAGEPIDLPLSSRKFIKRDRVMQIRNNYEKGVFNGDIGRIVGVNDNQSGIMVQFAPDKRASYDTGDLSELVLAYAVTIHKSQGSEYPVVVIPLLTQHYMMLQRNLLYTALTRARDLAVIVGTKKAIGIAVSNEKVEDRYTLLSERLTRRASE
ncbi:ATP-dependent RecD-like DNA helicase [Candidatus Bipolaricaulota bacterium]|nr:ATP-dependent RecD-like DNA helicase [Candidatus Bipolaricaulota bacterium]